MELTRRISQEEEVAPPSHALEWVATGIMFIMAWTSARTLQSVSDSCLVRRK